MSCISLIHDLVTKRILANTNYDTAFPCPSMGHWCFMDQLLHISAVGNLKSYLKRFMFLVQLTDIAFFNLLSSVTGGFNLYYTFHMDLYIQNLTRNPLQFEFQSAMEKLFKWVSCYVFYVR